MTRAKMALITFVVMTPLAAAFGSVIPLLAALIVLGVLLLDIIFFGRDSPR